MTTNHDTMDRIPSGAQVSLPDGTIAHAYPETGRLGAAGAGFCGRYRTVEASGRTDTGWTREQLTLVDSEPEDFARPTPEQVAQMYRFAGNHGQPRFANLCILAGQGAAWALARLAAAWDRIAGATSDDEIAAVMTATDVAEPSRPEQP